MTKEDENKIASNMIAMQVIIAGFRSFVDSVGLSEQARVYLRDFVEDFKKGNVEDEKGRDIDTTKDKTTSD